MKSTIVLFLGSALLLGCGGAAVKQQEKAVAQMTLKFQASTEDFARARRAIVRARQASLAATEESALATRQRVDQEATLLRFKDKERSDLFAAIVAATSATGAEAEEMDKLRSENRSALEGAGTRFSVDKAKLGEIIKALTQLSSEKPGDEELEFYLAYLQTVGKEIKGLQDKADKEAKSADKTAGTAAAP